MIHYSEIFYILFRYNITIYGTLLYICMFPSTPYPYITFSIQIKLLEGRIVSTGFGLGPIEKIKRSNSKDQKINAPCQRSFDLLNFIVIFFW